MNLDGRLVIDDRGKRKTVPQRNGRVALDNLRKQSAASFESKTQRQHVEQYDVFHVATQNAALNRRTHRHYFVRIDLRRRFPAKDFFYRSLYDWRPRLA